MFRCTLTFGLPDLLDSPTIQTLPSGQVRDNRRNLNVQVISRYRVPDESIDGRGTGWLAQSTVQYQSQLHAAAAQSKRMLRREPDTFANRQELVHPGVKINGGMLGAGIVRLLMTGGFEAVQSAHACQNMETCCSSC
jgi:hypothetical protein